MSSSLNNPKPITTKNDILSTYFKQKEPYLDTQSIVSLHDGHPLETDGKMHLKEYLKSRIDAGLNEIGLADHNTLFTNYKAREYIKTNGIENFDIIPSIEISTLLNTPGHLILLDFDLDEFNKIFYEKYLKDYLLNDFENRDKLSSEYITQLKNKKYVNFQPSKLTNSTNIALVFEAIINMKKDPIYAKIIFPGDTLEDIFSKISFHYKGEGEEGNTLKKIPIIQIPHPMLGKKPKKHFNEWIQFFQNRGISIHINGLTKKGMTTYGGLMRNKEGVRELMRLLKEFKNSFQNARVLCEIYNAGEHSFLEDNVLGLNELEKLYLL